MLKNASALPTLPGFQAKALLRAGKTEEAISFLKARVEARPSDHAGWHQLAVLECQRRSFLAALKAIDRAIARAPGELAYQRVKGLALANLGSCKEAIGILSPIVDRYPNDYFGLHALQIACSKGGETDLAITLGTRILALEDRVATRKQVAPPVESPQRLRARQRVIAFSLWGSNPIYVYGALVNAKLVRFVFPGWKCRFYVGTGVPPEAIGLLKNAGAEVVDGAKEHPEVSPALWRFLVADDPDVAMFLCRDCDARIGPKEAAAVDAWLRSGRAWHVMRDHVLHRNVILAGMWGGRTALRLRVKDRVQQFSSGRMGGTYGADQRFLAQQIWPVIRQDCLIHDSYYPLFGAQPFPVMGKGTDHFHVGMSIVGESRLARDAGLLGLPWPRLTLPRVE